MSRFFYKSCIFALVILGIISCSTVETAPDAKTWSLQQLIYNKGSMTKALESLDHKFSVELIKNGIVENNYVRLSSLKLDSTPVIAAVVTTNVANQTFMTILRKANTTPIGKMLFAKNSGITRQEMQVQVIKVADVPNSVTHGYLNRIGYNDATQIVERNSEFDYSSEKLNVIEYILPSMTKYFNK